MLRHPRGVLGALGTGVHARGAGGAQPSSPLRGRRLALPPSAVVLAAPLSAVWKRDNAAGDSLAACVPARGVCATASERGRAREWKKTAGPLQKQVGGVCASSVSPQRAPRRRFAQVQADVPSTSAADARAWRRGAGAECAASKAVNKCTARAGAHAPARLEFMTPRHRATAVVRVVYCCLRAAGRAFVTCAAG